jgi:hypothetical protein
MSRRTLGWGLVAYAVVGLALIVTGAVVGLDTASRIERLATEADGAISAAARATEAAADSFTNIDASLAEAGESAAAAANLARDAAGTLRALAVAMELSILGAQPLLPLANEFATSANQASELATTLGSVASSLVDTRTDVVQIGVELDVLSRELASLQVSSGAGAPPPLRLFVALLLAWIAIPAVGSLIAGMALLRSRREVTIS